MATWKEALQANGETHIPAIAHHAALSISLRADGTYRVLTEQSIIANRLTESEVDAVLRERGIDPNTGWE